MHSIDHNSFTTFFQNIPLNLHIKKGPNAIITIEMDTKHLFLSHTFAWRWSLYAYLSCHLKWTIVGTFCFNFRCLPFVVSFCPLNSKHTHSSYRRIVENCFVFLFSQKNKTWFRCVIHFRRYMTPRMCCSVESTRAHLTCGKRKENRIQMLLFGNKFIRSPFLNKQSIWIGTK